MSSLQWVLHLQTSIKSFLGRLAQFQHIPSAQQLDCRNAASNAGAEHMLV